MSNAVDRFLAQYYARRPVNATFTGVHAYDAELPDWSATGLSRLDGEMRASLADLREHHPAVPVAGGPSRGAAATSAADLDAELACGFLEIQLAENASEHGVRRNPALWTGEAIFSVVALMIRDFAPLDDRVGAATARLDTIPAFLYDAGATIGERPIPGAWSEKARRDIHGAIALFERGIDRWLASAPHTRHKATFLKAAATRALGAFERFDEWLVSRPVADEATLACGTELYDLLLARGHFCPRTRAELLADAKQQLGTAKMALHEMARSAAGSWDAVQEALAADHPPASDYLDSFGRIWNECRARVVEQDAVTWPEWPIRYTEIPEWTREAAPSLYYLYYRSPAPFDAYTTYDYVVPPLPANPAQHLGAWNHSVIKLNHVVHHGAVGHHVQNWHACHQARSRVGQVAAVDCANRIGMFLAGTMAEGWACYATELMDELGFLNRRERVSEQHSRVRFLARAVVDIEMHQGSMTFGGAVRFYESEVGMPAAVARAEAVKNSMFPGTAITYWLGSQGILDLRATMQQRHGIDFSLRRFHDDLLGWGSIPVPVVARLMLEGAP